MGFWIFIGICAALIIKDVMSDKNFKEKLDSVEE